MAKYNWQQLEKEYILSNHKTVSSFLRDKKIPNNGSTRKQTSGWKDKKRDKQDKTMTKTIQKVIEKESEKEANKIVKVNDVANKLLEKIMVATDELNKSTDMFGTIHDSSIIDRVALKKLTSALKDLNDILGDKTNENIQRIQIVNDLPVGEDNET